MQLNPREHSNLLNAKNMDLKQDIALIAALEQASVAGVDRPKNALLKRVQKQLGTKESDVKTLTTLAREAESKMAMWFKFDNTVKTLEDAGATDKEVSGLLKFKSRLEKGIIKNFAISESDLASEDEEEGEE